MNGQYKSIAVLSSKLAGWRVPGRL